MSQSTQHKTGVVEIILFIIVAVLWIGFLLAIMQEAVDEAPPITQEESVDGYYR